MKKIHLFFTLLLIFILSSCSFMLKEESGLSISLPSRTSSISYTSKLCSDNGLYTYEKVSDKHIVFTDLKPSTYTLTIRGEDINNVYSYEGKVEILQGVTLGLTIILNKTPKSEITPSPLPDVSKPQIFDTTYTIDNNMKVIKIDALPQEKIPKEATSMVLGRTIISNGFEPCINDVMKTSFVTTDNLANTYVGDPFVLNGKQYSYILYYKDKDGNVLAKSNPVNVVATFTGLSMYFYAPEITISYDASTNSTVWNGFLNTSPDTKHSYSIVYEKEDTKETIEGVFIRHDATNSYRVSWDEYPTVKDGRYKFVCFKDTIMAEQYQAIFNLHIFEKEIKELNPNIQFVMDLKRTVAP